MVFFASGQRDCHILRDRGPSVKEPNDFVILSYGATLSGDPLITLTTPAVCSLGWRLPLDRVFSNEPGTDPPIVLIRLEVPPN